MGGTEGRDSKGRFIKGSTGNKCGRPKVVTELRQLAREQAPEAFKKIAELMDSENERVALAACQEILNRAYGKPEQAHKLEGDGLKPVVVVVREGAEGV